MSKKRICENEDCQKEYELTPNKAGRISVCGQCGREEEADIERPLTVPRRRARILR